MEESYVETWEEQRLGDLWQSNPFTTLHSVVRTIITGQKNSNHDGMALLRRLTESSPSTHEHLFSLLYGTTRDHGLKEQTIRDYDLDKKRHFLLNVAYLGNEFCGWQRQIDHPDGMTSVQQVLEDWLQTLPGQKDIVDIQVAGRTDAGVSAMGQICRFRTFQAISSQDLRHHLQQMPLESVRVTNVTRVSRAFHPSFGATCRAYIYLIDVWEGWTIKQINLLNTLLQPLEGNELDYIAMSYGRLKTENSLCTLYHARACLVESTFQNDDHHYHQAIAIELVGNRFLRRMVRLLVATALRLTLQQTPPHPTSLLKLVQDRDRLQIFAPAPPDGLAFVGAMFEDL